MVLKDLCVALKYVVYNLNNYQPSVILGGSNNIGLLSQKGKQN